MSVGKYHALGVDFRSVGYQRVDVHAGVEGVGVDRHVHLASLPDVAAKFLAAVQVVVLWYSSFRLAVRRIT